MSTWSSCLFLIWWSIAPLAAQSLTVATGATGEVFLGNPLIEAGICASGTLGTAYPAPNGFTPAPPRRALGLRRLDQPGDAVLPGDVGDGFTLSWIGAGEAVRTCTNAERSGEAAINQSLTVQVTRHLSWAVTRWQASTPKFGPGERLEVEQIAWLGDHEVLRFQVTIRNTGAVGLADVRYLRLLDPDLDADASTRSAYATRNRIVSQMGSSGAATVEAISLRTGNRLGITTADPRTRASRGNHLRNARATTTGSTPYGRWDNPAPADGYGINGDDCIALTTRIGTLAPKATAVINFYLYLGSSSFAPGSAIAALGQAPKPTFPAAMLLTKGIAPRTPETSEAITTTAADQPGSPCGGGAPLALLIAGGWMLLRGRKRPDSEG